MRTIISENKELELKKDKFGNICLAGHFTLSEKDPQFTELYNPLVRDEVVVEVIWDDPNIETAESNDDIDWYTYKVYINGEYAGNQDDFEIVGEYHW